MKKTIFALTLLCMATSAFAKKDDTNNKNEKALCTIVVSPCPEVPSTSFSGTPSYEEIKKAQEEMRKKCEEIAKSKA